MKKYLFNKFKKDFQDIFSSDVILEFDLLTIPLVSVLCNEIRKIISYNNKITKIKYDGVGLLFSFEEQCPKLQAFLSERITGDFYVSELNKKIEELATEYQEFILNKEPCYSKRLFYKPIFMGNGDKSLLDTIHLHNRMSYGLSLLSGEQQNGGMGYSYSKEDYEEYKKGCFEVVEDVICALGLKEKVIFEWKNLVEKTE